MNRFARIFFWLCLGAAVVSAAPPRLKAPAVAPGEQRHQADLDEALKGLKDAQARKDNDAWTRALIQVTETTRNRGVSGAVASRTRFYLGTSPTFDASAVEIGSREVPALNAAATSMATTPVRIPATAGAAGTYYLFAVADADHGIVETLETNNATADSVRIMVP